MGIYDRQYARDDQPGLNVSAPQSVTMRLVVATFAVYVIQVLAPEFIVRWFAVTADWYTRPWEFYKLLTYGFLHSTDDVWHILINMLVLGMFGRDVEHRYGARHFLAFYLSAIVFAAAAWSLGESAYGTAGTLVGASGGIAGIVALYALNFPHRKVLLYFVIPVPMWVAAILLLLLDINGAMNRSGNVAYTAHLAGALFGLVYFKYQWNPGLWVADRISRARPSRKPRLRVHTPSTDESDDEMSEAVDEILRKIQESGQDSLTRRERKILEKASREFQRRR